KHQHGDWIAEGGIDPSTAYKVRLPGGKSMDVFFYDGPISQAIAFEKLLHSGITFADRLLGAFAEHRDWPQLVHIATDGETYGHHHRHGEMALAYAVEYIQDLPGVDIINYGAYLAKYPPVFEAEIHDSSSWSCVHGVERWKADCGCDSGMNGDWHQKWRAPLRQSFDWLRDTFIPLYESEAGRYFSDPWKARDAYIDIILDRSNENLMEFIANQAARTLSEDEIVHAVQLLEIQRHAMLMYTSCGWFFDEISGIETVQCLQYAGRAIQLARKVLDIDLEPEFLHRLEQAPGNVPAHSNGRQVYEQLVMPAMVDLEQVCAHYVISSLFESFESRRVYNFEVELKEHSLMERARYRFAVGRARVRSRVTLESHLFTFAVLHMGEHNLNAGIRVFQSDEDYAGILNEAEDLYNAGDIPDLIRFMDRHFGGSGYTLRSLFHDQQRQIVQEMLAGTLAEVEAWAKQVRDKHLPLISYLIDLGHPLPMIFRNLADVFNNAELRALLAEEPPEMERFARVLAESRLWDVNLDLPGLGRALTDRLESMILRLKADPENHRLLNRILEGMAIVIDLELPLDFWKLQNEYYAIHERYFPAMQKLTTEDARSWLQDFRHLGELLDMDIEVPDSPTA
ncbi:MAG: DUF3536 domain-containing protein, partial [Leptospiraceae bacterium]|nr:DUF3536 domain-containing protein [Leptospiraceae bacterium]